MTAESEKYKKCSVNAWLHLMIDICPFKNVFFSSQEEKYVAYNVLCKRVFHLSNWQKVQLITDLFSDTQKYLYTNQMI